MDYKFCEQSMDQPKSYLNRNLSHLADLTSGERGGLSKRGYIERGEVSHLGCFLAEDLFEVPVVLGTD